MKTNKLFQFLTLAICAVAFAFVTGCEGPVGPIGPAGPAGAKGADGTDGTDGVAGSAECLACHSSDAKYRVTQQYEGSVHALGERVRGSTSCAMCHSNEGLLKPNGQVWT